jgi:methanogenic corrinoid protein MtbC1
MSAKWTPATALHERKDVIADDVVAAEYARRPDLLARYGEHGRAFCRRDNGYHLAYLAAAVEGNDPALFVDYVAWARAMLFARGIPPVDLTENLLSLRAAIRHHLPVDAVAGVTLSIDVALEQLPSSPDVPPSYVATGSANGGLAGQYLDFLLSGDRRGALEVVQQAVGRGVPLKRIYLDVFQASQREIGRLWQLNRITVAKEHYCTAATLAIMNRLFGQILEAPPAGRRIAALCVAGELHEVGLRVVADLFELAGWDCDFYGANTPAESLFGSLASAPPALITVSATMTYHVPLVAAFIEALRATPSIARIPVMVGGRPFLVSQSLWRTVGADGWAVDAEDAVLKGAELVAAG